MRPRDRESGVAAGLVGVNWRGMEGAEGSIPGEGMVTSSRGDALSPLHLTPYGRRRMRKVAPQHLTGRVDSRRPAFTEHYPAPRSVENVRRAHAPARAMVLPTTTAERVQAACAATPNPSCARQMARKLLQMACVHGISKTTSVPRQGTCPRPGTE